MPRSPRPGWKCSRSTPAGSTAATATCARRGRRSSAAARSSDCNLLEAVATKFGGGPVGLSTLAIAVGEEQDTIEDVFEPYLLQQGMLKRTPRGRVLTERAYQHLGLPAPEGSRSLF